MRDPRRPIVHQDMPATNRGAPVRGVAWRRCVVAGRAARFSLIVAVFFYLPPWPWRLQPSTVETKNQSFCAGPPSTLATLRARPADKLRARPADADAVSWPIKYDGQTIGTEGEELDLSEANLSEGDFEGTAMLQAWPAADADASWSTGGGGGSASPFAFTFVAEGATNSPGTGPSPSFRDQVPSPSFSFKYVRGNRYQGDAAVAQIAVSGGAESAGQLPAKQTIGMEDEAPDLSVANLPGGDFSRAP